MAKVALNLQDGFLNQVRRENAEIKIIMLDGSTEHGTIQGFDNFTVVLRSTDGNQHLLYKHAIAQVITARSSMQTVVPQEHSGTTSRKPSGFNTLDLSPLFQAQGKKEGK